MPQSRQQVGNQDSSLDPKEGISHGPHKAKRARVTLLTVGDEQACGQLREGIKGWSGITNPSFSADSYLKWLSQLLRKEVEACA